MAENIDVGLCVNNHRNGVFCGRLSAVNIDDFMNIECAEVPERGCTLNANFFSVHREKFVYLTHKYWVGNWCWDSIRLRPVDVARLVALLLSKREQVKATGEQYNVWAVDCAHGEAAIALADKHRAFQPISADEILAAMRAEGVVAAR